MMFRPLVCRPYKRAAFVANLASFAPSRSVRPSDRRQLPTNRTASCQLRRGPRCYAEDYFDLQDFCECRKVPEAQGVPRLCSIRSHPINLAFGQRYLNMQAIYYLYFLFFMNSDIFRQTSETVVFACPSQSHKFCEAAGCLTDVVILSM